MCLALRHTVARIGSFQLRSAFAILVKSVLEQREPLRTLFLNIVSRGYSQSHNKVCGDFGVNKSVLRLVLEVQICVSLPNADNVVERSSRAKCSYKFPKFKPSQIITNKNVYVFGNSFYFVVF